MMNFSFHPEALQEYIEATHYYREISKAWGSNLYS